VTTVAVLMEYGNILSKGNVREKALRFIQILRDDDNAEIIFINSELFEKGLGHCGKYKDKEWGLVDCMSFIIMKEKGIVQALTSDSHFEQAGFSILLKPSLNA